MMLLSATRCIPAAFAVSAMVMAAWPASAEERAAEKAASSYCQNIADAAADARVQLQKQQLAGMEKEIEARVKVLEAKRAEYEAWIKRRNEVLQKADETVVAIYSKMRPDAAALQLATMQDEIAAAILAKLSPRVAGAVLNEMEPARAAQLANVMTDAPRRAAENAS